MEDIPIIQTSVYNRFDWAIRHVAKTAGLGVVRGPVGIGKSFAVSRVAKTLQAENINVIVATSTPTIEGNIGAFAKSILAQFGVYERTAIACIEALETLVMGNPFGYPPQQSILIVDEGQGLRVPVLSMMRQIWDLGDHARLTQSHGRAFGLLLCGNNTFLNRRGKVREMDFHPLKNRITLNLRLDASDKSELNKAASQFCAHDPEAAAVLAKYGRSRGNIRSIATTYREASGLADGSPITVAHINDAIAMIGGI